MLLKLLSHSFGCCQGLLLASCSVQFYFVEVGGGISMLKSDSLWSWGGSMSVAFSFFVNFREVLAATRFEILQVRVLEPLREPAFLVSSQICGMQNSCENYSTILKERDFKINFDLTIGGFGANRLGHAIQKLGPYSQGSDGTSQGRFQTVRMHREGDS